jgi:hypothetical protein
VRAYYTLCKSDVLEHVMLNDSRASPLCLARDLTGSTDEHGGYPASGSATLARCDAQLLCRCKASASVCRQRNHDKLGKGKSRVGYGSA